MSDVLFSILRPDYKDMMLFITLLVPTIYVLTKSSMHMILYTWYINQQLFSPEQTAQWLLKRLEFLEQ